MQPSSDETLSSYIGAQLRPSDINTGLIHLYRAEVTRANSWRSRLDVHSAHRRRQPLRQPVTRPTITVAATSDQEP